MFFNASVSRLTLAQQKLRGQNEAGGEGDANQPRASRGNKSDNEDARDLYLRILGRLCGFALFVIIDIIVFAAWLAMVRGPWEGASGWEVLGMLCAVAIFFIICIVLCGITLLLAHDAVQLGRRLVTISATEFPDRDLAYAD